MHPTDPSTYTLPKPHILSAHHPDTVRAAASIVRDGGVILYPTDTVYGLGCDPFNKQAVEKIVRIKQRAKKKMMLLIARDREMVERFAHIHDLAQNLADVFWPGPLSLVLPRREGTLTSFYLHEDSIVFRVPKHEFSQFLLSELDIPLVSTSANNAGDTTQATPNDILTQLGEHASLIDLVVDAGSLASLPSTLVSVTTESPELLRQGVISQEEIVHVLKAPDTRR